MNRWHNSSASFPSAALVALLVLAPRAVHACAVCFGGQEGDTRTAFILTTAFLTFAPLLMIGATVWWLRRRFRQLEVEACGAPSERESRVHRDSDGEWQSESG